MKKILLKFLVLVMALSCLTFIGCENQVGNAEDMQATLNMYIFDKDEQTLADDFVLPGTIGDYKTTWTSDNEIITLEELAGDEANGIERQYVAKVGLPEERTAINLTVALSAKVKKTFTVYVNALSVYDFSGSYNFIKNNGTVVADFDLDTTCEFKGHTATIAWSVDEEYADYLAISEDGKKCLVTPSSLNPKVRINATFTYNGESTTKGYRMTVSEQKDPLQEVDYWYTNEGVGIVMSGYVVSIATAYSESYGNVSLYMVNDEFTAGYYLYRVKADSASGALLAPGVHVTATGTTNTNYNGLIETNAGGNLVVDVDIPSIDVSEKVYAIDNDILGNLQSAYYHQSRLVSLTNWTVKSIYDPVAEGKTATLFVLTKGGVDVSIAVSKYLEGAYACNAADATWSALAALQNTVKEGDIVSVTGILGNYKGHQIMPLSADAVVVGGTADAEGTVYAGQTAAKAVAAIDKIISDNGLNELVLTAKNVALPASVEGCEVSYRIIGTSRSMSINEGTLVINPGKQEQACLTAVITVDGFTTNIFRYIEVLGGHEHDFTGEWLKDKNKHWKECSCGEIAEEGEHAFVDGVCVCGELEPVPVAGEIELTVDSLKLPADSYSAGTVTVNGVSFEYIQLGNYGDGIQMRDKDGNTSMLWSTSAFGTGISKIELVYSATKSTYDNPDAVIFSFGNSMKEAAYSTKLSTTAGVKNYTITPDASTYTYLYIEHDLGYSMYWESITIYFTGSVDTPVECEHEWSDATCTAPKTCSKCGATEGEVADHTFVNGACSVCGAKDPNYVAPGEKVFGIIDAPVAGTAYKFGMVQGNLNDGKVYYLAGGMSGYYMATTTDENAAIDVYLEETTGGYYLYAMVNGAKTYINMVVSGTHVNGAYEAAASTVYRYDAESKTVIAVVNDADYWFGTRNDKTYTTVGPCAVSYQGFYCMFYGWIESEAPVVCEHEGGTATCKELAICSKCGEAYGELAAHVADTRGLSYNADGHWYDCINCQKPATEVEAHTFVEGKCVCGAADPDYVAPEVSTWTLVTELKDGDQVLIGAPAYGKLLSAEKVSATSYYNKGVNYAADDFSNVTDAEIFVVTIDADGYYIFTSLTGKVIALADSYSSLNDTGAHKTWTLVAKGETTFLMKNVGRNTYLEWYSSKDNWSTYTAGNTNEYEISFYAMKSEAPVVCEHEGGTATCTELAICSKCGKAYGELAAHAWADATCTAPKTCSKCGATEGEVAEHTFVEGVCSACGAEDPNYVAPEVPVVGGGKADLDSIANYSSSYASATTANGWVISNSAIQAGGSTDMNPQFTVIGPDATTKAVCLNGKVSAPGSLVSPTLNGGIGVLKFNWTKMFTDTALKMTVTVTDLASGTAQTYVIDVVLDKNDKYTLNTVEWILETPITGDFTISFVNNCPTANTGNKDRITVWNIEWTAPEAGCAHTGGTATCKELAVCELCGEAYGELAAHAWADATCQAPKTCSVCGETEGEVADHNFNILKGIHSDANHWYECACGEKGEEVVPHVDTDLDITCDYEGCTKRFIPAADSHVSLFTANAMRVVSLSGNYYVEGVVTLVDDAKNGVFVITDEAGDSLTIRLPKNAEGTAYSSWTSGKVVLGDTIQVYGQPKTTTATSLAPKAMIQSGVLTVLKHEHVFSEPTCTKDGVCECLAVGTPALGHLDADNSGLCDRCDWNMKLVVSTINTHTNTETGTNGVVDDAKTFWTWSDDNFEVVIAKGTSTSTLYTTAKAYMQLKKLNTLTVVNKNGATIASIVISTTNATQLTNLKNALAGIEFTADDNALTVTIAWNSAEEFTFSNKGTQTAYIASVAIVFEPAAPAECAHEGGNATCKELAVCAKCGEAYGELADHVWDDRGYSYNDEKHWVDCVVCQNAKNNEAAHAGEWIVDENGHEKECATCFKMIVDWTAHDFSNGDCECGAKAPAAIEVLTVAEFIAMSAGMAHNTYTTDKFYVAGIITAITNTTYGNMTIKDATGEVLIYGTYSADGSTQYGSMSNKPVVGDTVVIYTVAGVYSNAPQGKNGWIVEQTSGHDCVFSTEWTADATHHWNACVYCAAVNEDSKAEHNFEGGECACGTSDPSAVSEVVFEFGNNSSAAHVDGNAYSGTKSYTVDGFTLSLTSLTKVYGPAYDAKGNSCIKLGTSSAVGSFKFTVPENVNKVIILVAKYKSNTTKINVNGTAYTLTKNSNNGEYDAIEVDTSSNKTVSFATVSGGVRCMINSITYVVG